ncbi:MAG: nucleotidyltransferase family protein [Gemmatimonadetes bacterium]|nr:nucleotidyltransferase family protein [Gemmatimonadota bacterium]
MIGAIVLAAGRGARFGGVKVLAMHAGAPLVVHVIDQLRASGLDRVIVTAGDHAEEISAAVAGRDVTVVTVDPEGGMSASIRAGIGALPRECDAFLVALGDQPGIDPAVVRRVIETWEGSTSAAVVPVYQEGVPGHPVLLDATLRRRLELLEGDRGARDLLQALGDRVAWMHVDASVPVDVDVPADLDRLGS